MLLHVAASIRRIGWQQPIVARRTGEVIAGNTRLEAAQSLGMAELPAWWFDGSDIDAVASHIADNRTHTLSEFDESPWPNCASSFAPMTRSTASATRPTTSMRLCRDEPTTAGRRGNVRCRR